VQFQSRVPNHQQQMHADIADQQCDRSRGAQRSGIRRGREKTKPDNVNVAARYGVLKVPLLIQDV
jgi:hypothetical protein